MRAPVWSDDPCEYERLAMSYIEECPDAWRLFVRFAFEAIAAGRSHIGAKLIMERIRWESMIGHGREPYKVNNSATAHIARAFARAYPEHCDLFRFRGSAPVVVSHQYQDVTPSAGAAL